MRSLAGTGVFVLGVAALLGSLSFVAWRQARALEDLEALDQARRERSLSMAERKELMERVEYLESRGRVEAEAGRWLGLRIPHGGEIVYLYGGPS